MKCDDCSYLGRATAGWSKPRAASGPYRPAHFAAPATECQPEGVSPVGRTMLQDTGTLHRHTEHTVAQSTATVVTARTNTYTGYVEDTINRQQLAAWKHMTCGF